MARADIVVAGAGGAGLSLALRLAAPAFRALRVVVLDERAAFARDRTWCFWDVHAHPFAGAVTHRWARWRVATRAGVVERGSARHAYQHVPADAFYAHALAALARAPHVELRLGTRVGAVVDAGDAVRVETAAGTVHAGHVFDSRPPHGPPNGGDAGPELVQAFAGAVVRTDAPAFDPAAVTLMDFTAEWRGAGVGFGYVLPYTAREALVELAVIAPAAPAAAALEGALARYAARLTGGAHAVVSREAGVLPMDAAPVDRRPSPRVTRVGVAGGVAKPSTGYAFLAMQRDADAIAGALRRALARGPWAGTFRGPAPAPRPGLARWLDGVFLRRLAADPAGAPALFARLFARAEPDALVRFLSDVGSPRDVARVVAALPAAPFALAAARGVWDDAWDGLWSGGWNAA